MLAFDGGVQEEDGYRFLAPGNIAAFKFLKNMQQKSCAWVASPDLPVYDRFAQRQALFATASLEEFPAQARAFSAAGSTDEWIALPFPGEEREALVVYGSSFVVFQSDERPSSPRGCSSAGCSQRRTRPAGWRARDSSRSAPRRWTCSADYSADHPQWAAAVEYISSGDITPQLSSWRLVRVMLEDGFRDMFDTIRHPDLTDGQVPVILKQMDETAEELNQ